MSDAERVRLGVILSAGGSAFAAAATIAAPFPLAFCVVTDRNCGAEARCQTLGIPVRRIIEPDRDKFSRAARSHFEQSGAAAVLLHFSRLVGADLFAGIPCYNVHPALLPAFPGMGAVKRAWSSGARFLGATLHVVDETVDMGPIIAQIVDPIPPGADLAWCQRLSFVQKTFLTLVFFELMVDERLRLTCGGPASSPRHLSGTKQADPVLTNEILVSGFQAFKINVEHEMVCPALPL